MFIFNPRTKTQEIKDKRAVFPPLLWRFIDGVSICRGQQGFDGLLLSSSLTNTKLILKSHLLQKPLCAEDQAFFFFFFQTITGPFSEFQVKTD